MFYLFEVRKNYSINRISIIIINLPPSFLYSFVLLLPLYYQIRTHYWYYRCFFLLFTTYVHHVSYFDVSYNIITFYNKCIHHYIYKWYILNGVLLIHSKTILDLTLNQWSCLQIKHNNEPINGITQIDVNTPSCVIPAIGRNGDNVLLIHLQAN